MNTTNTQHVRRDTSSVTVALRSRARYEAYEGYAKPTTALEECQTVSELVESAWDWEGRTYIAMSERTEAPLMIRKRAGMRFAQERILAGESASASRVTANWKPVVIATTESCSGTEKKSNSSNCKTAHSTVT